jgi:hypothetical protein
MHCRLILLFLAAASTSTTARSDTMSQIKVLSEPATVEITAQPAGRRLIQLPALEFSLTIEPQCESDMRVESISISVADTRKTVTAVEADKSIVATTLTLPSRQAAPLALVDFCQSDEDQSRSSREVLVREAFTAHLSLRCSNDERQSIVYASQALDLALRCESGDQEPSADSVAR